MYISSLKMTRFGMWADLKLSGFCEGLNVIYGPNSSGKTTVVRFLSGMLYGFDADTRRRYLPADARASGALTLQGSFGRRTVVRHDEGSGRDSLIVENADASVGGAHRLHELLGGVRQDVFERVFQVDFEGDLDIDKLAQTALAEGFDLLGSHHESDRITELQDRLHGKRQALAEIATAEIAFDELVRRRRSLQQETEALQATLEQRRTSWERRLGKLDAVLADLTEQIDTIEDELASINSEIDARQADQQGREVELRQARQRRQQLETERRQGLCEIDDQLARWRGVLKDLEDRRRGLRDQTELAIGVERHRGADPRGTLRKLEDGLDRLQHSLADLTTTAGDSCQCQSLRAVLYPALTALREDVYRLCNELSDWEVRTQQRENHGQLSQTQRCEAELRAAIADLALQRQTLLAELRADPAADQLAVHPDQTNLCHCHHHPRFEDAASSGGNDDVQDETLLAWHAELRRLGARRDALRENLAALKDELRERNEQRRQTALECDPEFEQHRLKSRQQELEGIEIQLRQFERRRELMGAVTSMEDELRGLTSQVQTPAILIDASERLRHLSDGDLLKLTVQADRSVWIQPRRGGLLAYHQLGSGGREQAYLSLCLALVAAYARRGTRLPLILNDAFANIDTSGVASGAAVLRDFCHQGHQILLFTRRQQVADRFRALDVAVRQLPSAEQPRQTAPVSPTDLDDSLSLNEINQQLNMLSDNSVAPAIVADSPMWSSEEFPGELTDRAPRKPSEPVHEPTRIDADLAAEFFLLESSPIQDAPSIDAATAERFRKIGVLLVRDLLHLDVVDAAHRLRYAGITAPMIRRWQAESLLTCRIPRLRPYDARILVACGIATPEQLAQLEAADLRRRVEHFAETSTGDVLIRAGNRYELSRLTEWIHAARRGRERSSAPHAVAGQPLPTGRDRDESAAREQRRRRSHTARRERPSIEQPNIEGPGTWHATGTEPRRERPAARHPSAAASSAPVGGNGVDHDSFVLKMDTEDAPIKFYLELTDPIERAPSIGPRTAQRLEANGIRTVADFLRADSAATASRLKRHSVNADVIHAWKQQSLLVCRVPWLRGYHAQLLVACGVTTPEALARQDAATLFRAIRQFAGASAGQRILRSAKTPDLEKVSQWIAWANQARVVRAA